MNVITHEYSYVSRLIWWNDAVTREVLCVGAAALTTHHGADICEAVDEGQTICSPLAARTFWAGMRSLPHKCV